MRNKQADIAILITNVFPKTWIVLEKEMAYGYAHLKKSPALIIGITQCVIMMHRGNKKIRRKQRRKNGVCCMIFSRNRIPPAGGSYRGRICFHEKFYYQRKNSDGKNVEGKRKTIRKSN